MNNSPSAPTFAVVGQPNEGKTSVVATLAEDDRALRSPRSGTTRHLMRYPVEIDGAEVMVLYDTPGFGSAGEVLEWLREHKAESNPAAAFLADPSHKTRYPEESAILKPLAEGGVAIYVIDGDREPDEVDELEAEILRLCRVARIGIINSKEGKGTHTKLWRQRLLADVSIQREFNACQAVFADRIKVLEAAKAVMPGWEQRMAEVIEAINGDWEDRLVSSAEAILDTLGNVVKFRYREVFGSKLEKERATKKAAEAVKDHVREIEKKFRKKILKLFRHHDDHWNLDPLLEMNIFNAEVWRLLGFSKKNLIIGGFLAGAALGALLDLAAGLHTLGTCAVIGGFFGAIGTWMAADKAVHWHIPSFHVGPFKLKGSKLGGTHVEAGIERRSKLPSVLLDRMLLFIEAAGSWAHGSPSQVAAACPTTQATTNGQKAGRIDNWSKQERAAVAAIVELFHREAIGKRIPQDNWDAAKRNVQEIFVQRLRVVTMGARKSDSPA